MERISNVGFAKTVEQIMTGKAGVVLCCTLNEIMMSSEDRVVRKAMRRADVLTPDGMPLVWYLRLKCGNGERVYGPDILKKCLELSNKNKSKIVRHVFIGDDKNCDFFETYGDYIVLPFKKKFEEDDYQRTAQLINRLHPTVVWVGLGARKQVLMADGLKRYGVDTSIVTVGAAFDFLSGNKVQAPLLIRKVGLEWLFRAAMEPKRLGGRYVSVFAFGIGRFLTRLVVGIRNKLFG